MTIPEIKNKWINKKDTIKKAASHNKDARSIAMDDISLILIDHLLADLDTLPECKTDHHNEALNLLMNLSNFGAEFEDEKMAVDLITEALKRTNECNGLKIDYTKETCTSCGCKNHKTE